MTKKNIFSLYRELPSIYRRLSFVLFLVNVSTFSAMPLLSVYMIEHLRLSATEAGIIIGIYFFAGRFLPLLTGALAGWIGHVRMILFGLVLRAIGFGSIFFFDSFWGLGFAAMLIGIGGACYEVAVFGIFSDAPDKDRESAILISYVALNIGVIVGPALGSVFAYFDLPLIFISSFILFLLLCLYCFSLRKMLPEPMAQASPWSGLQTMLGDRKFIIFLLLSMPWWFLFAQLLSLMPVQIVTLGGSEAWSGSVLIVNGVVGIFIQLLLSTWIARQHRIHAMAGLYSLSALGMIVAIFSFNPWILLTAVALFSTAEALMMPLLELITADFAKGKSGSTYYGGLNFVWAIGASLGSGAGLAIAENAGYIWAWSLLVGLALLAAFLCIRKRQLTKSNMQLAEVK